LNTKQAKDFLVEQTAEQAALEGVPLADVEKRMMYFTESDPASCDDPIALNDAFEAQYETKEYEAKISRLLHHAYTRLKQEDPERTRNWDQAIRTLRKGDHYFLVMWDTKPPSEHPTRDTFMLIGIGMVIAVGVVMGAILASNYNINVDRYKKYVPVGIVVLVVLATGGYRTIFRLLWTWYHQTFKEDEPSS
jgi:hypothetical protein